MEEPRPVAGRHRDEVRQRRGRRAVQRGEGAHRAEHLLLVGLAQGRPVERVRIGEQVRGLVDKGIRRLDRGPQRRRRLEALTQEAS